MEESSCLAYLKKDALVCSPSLVHMKHHIMQLFTFLQKSQKYALHLQQWIIMLCYVMDAGR